MKTNEMSKNDPRNNSDAVRHPDNPEYDRVTRGSKEERIEALKENTDRQKEQGR